MSASAYQNSLRLTQDEAGKMVTATHKEGVPIAHARVARMHAGAHARAHARARMHAGGAMVLASTKDPLYNELLEQVYSV